MKDTAHAAVIDEGGKVGEGKPAVAPEDFQVYQGVFSPSFPPEKRRGGDKSGDDEVNGAGLRQL
jgi:hypothetical protein